jgi:hypothetical protein
MDRETKLLELAALAIDVCSAYLLWKRIHARAKHFRAPRA